MANAELVRKSLEKALGAADALCDALEALKNDMRGVADKEDFEKASAVNGDAAKLPRPLFELLRKYEDKCLVEDDGHITELDVVTRMDKLIPKLEDVLEEVQQCHGDLEFEIEGGADEHSMEALDVARSMLIIGVDDFEMAFLRYAEVLGYSTENYQGKFEGDPHGECFR